MVNFRSILCGKTPSGQERNMTKRKITRLIPILLVLVALIICSFFIMRAPTQDAFADGVLNGEGTEKNPFVISNATELKTFASWINEGTNADKVYSLTADVNMQDESFTAIGYVSTKPFQGTFNGNGHVIYNLSVTNTGVFGYTAESALIDGLGVYGASVVNTSSNNVGGIVGYNQGKVKNSFFNGKVEGYRNVGGVVGLNEGEVSTSYSSGQVVSNHYFVGGIVGKNTATLTNSYSLSQVYSKLANAVNVGGVIGGRDGDSRVVTPVFCYFDGVLNPTLKAIGYGSNDCIDQEVVEDINDKQNKVCALTQEEFQSLTIRDLFDEIADNSAWVREYSTTDHSAYYAPALKKHVPASLDYDVNYFYRNSVAIRRYGYDGAFGVWGSEENPYLITSRQELDNLAWAVNEKAQNYAGCFFRLTKDVDMQGENFDMIGNYNLRRDFQGTFDGNNKTISNMKVDYTTTGEESYFSYVGMFGSLGMSAKVKNLNLDETCTFVGTENVGSVAGYSYGATIENVKSSANVQGRNQVGGIVGQAYSGALKDVLSLAKFTQTVEVAYPQFYGIIGAISASQPTMTNVWYVADTKIEGETNRFTSTNNQGNVLIVDVNNGAIVATKANDGIITFTDKGIDADWKAQFRRSNEEVVTRNTSYSPDRNITSRTDIVYARFVKELELIEPNYGVTMSVNGDYNEFYEGQSVVVTISIPDSYFVKSVDFYNESSALVESTGIYTAGQAGSLLYSTTMPKDAKSLAIDVNSISWTSDAILEQKFYDGTPTTFDITKITTLPNDLTADTIDEGDFRASVAYDNITPPVKANVNGQSYALNVIFKRLSNGNQVQVGIRKFEFSILKARTIEVPVSAVTLQKEYDGTRNVYIPTTVDQTRKDPLDSESVGISGIYGNDDVVVNAEIAFVNAAIDTNASVKIRYSLTGADAANYEVPAEVTANGVITKRTLYVNVINRDMEYVGALVAPTYALENKDDPKLEKCELAFDFIEDGGVTGGNVGSYKMAVTCTTGSAYYEVVFRNEDGKLNDASHLNVSYVNINVVPRKVSVTYENVNNVSYDGSEKTVNAYYLDVNKNKVILAVEYSQNGTPITAPINAGEYVVTAMNSDTNYDITATETTVLVVNKAIPEDISVTSPATHVFGSNYEVTIDKDGEFSVTIDDASTGNATINGNVLTPTKAGTLELIVTKLATTNYEAISTSFTLEITKKEITIALTATTTTYSEDIEYSFVFDGDVNNPVPQGFVAPDVYITIGDERVILDTTLDYPAGSYDIDFDASTLVSDGYTIVATETSATLTINPKEIVVRAVADGHVYGEQDKELKYTVDGYEELVLEGSLSREEGVGVGEYDILQGTLNNEDGRNKNFAIVDFVSAIYDIEEATIIVTINSQEKKYGEQDPAIKYTLSGLVGEDTEESIGFSIVGKIARTEGESAYVSYESYNYATYQYNALATSFAHVSNNYKAEVVVDSSAVLKIVPVAPTTDNALIVNVPYGSSIGEIDPQIAIKAPIYSAIYGWQVNENIECSMQGYLTPDAVPDFSNVEYVEYEYKFVPVDRNYTEVTFVVKALPVKKEITISFAGTPSSFTYTGSSVANSIQYSFSGVEEGDDLGATIEYEGNLKNVGTYTVNVKISNGNYLVKNTASLTINIKKAKLSVSLIDMEINEGDEPANYSFIYTGFVGNDSVSSLTTTPKVDFPSEPGVHEIAPYGASADNYTINYEKFTFTVKAIKLTSKDNQIIVNGTFNPDVEISVEEITEGGEKTNVDHAFNKAKDAYDSLDGTALKAIYKIVGKVGDENVDKLGVSSFEFVLPEDLLASVETLTFLIMTEEGDLVLSYAKVSNGKVAIDVDNARYIVIAEPQESNTMLYVLIGIGAVAVILIIIFIAVAVSKKRKARYVVFND